MTLALRVTLALVALSNAVTGALAAAAPRSFFDSYPIGRGWVAGLPPFNAHLTTDVGGFNLAFAILFGWAAARPQRALVLPLAGAWTVSGLIHFAWHATHLEGLGATDAVVQTTGLAAVLAPCGLALVALRGSGSADQPADDPAQPLDGPDDDGVQHDRAVGPEFRDQLHL